MITGYRSFFQALSNTTRLRIIELLRYGPKSVTEIHKSLRIDQTRASHALKCLTNCHFVECEQKGKKRIYRINNSLNSFFLAVDRHVKKNCRNLEECRVIHR